MSKGGFAFMEHGKTVCENNDLTCRKTSIGEFRRTRRECRAGWNPDMPISLCAEHAGDRVPLTLNELDKIQILIFD